MIRMFFRAAPGVLALSFLATPALAHVSLEHGEATIGSSYRAVLRVPHGCGDDATTAISVTIPEGFAGAQPMLKPGWTLETHADADGRVKEITWSDGELPAAFYDEFIFRGSFAPYLEPGVFAFPTVQHCGAGEEAWTGGEDGQPAPALTLLPADSHAGHGAHGDHAGH